MTQWSPRSCTRCGGDRYYEEGGWVCLQCGRRYEEPRPAPLPALPVPADQTEFYRARYNSIQELYFNHHLSSDTIKIVLSCARKTVWRGIERGREQGMRKAAAV